MQTCAPAVDQTVKARLPLQETVPERRLRRTPNGKPRPDQPRRAGPLPRELRRSRANDDSATSSIAPIEGRGRQGSAAIIPELRVGASSATPAPARRSRKSFSDDFAKAETMSVPITIRDPDPGLRHARRRRHPRSCLALTRGLRHASACSAPLSHVIQPRPERQLRGVADRDGGRRGLHAVSTTSSASVRETGGRGASPSAKGDPHRRGKPRGRAVLVSGMTVIVAHGPGCSWRATRRFTGMGPRRDHRGSRWP